MSDEELLERIRLDEGYLLAHGRYAQIDHVRELVARLAAAKSESDRLLGVIAAARSHLRDGEAISALAVLRGTLDDAAAQPSQPIQL